MWKLSHDHFSFLFPSLLTCSIKYWHCEDLNMFYTKGVRTFLQSLILSSLFVTTLSLQFGAEDWSVEAKYEFRVRVWDGQTPVCGQTVKKTYLQTLIEGEFHLAKTYCCFSWWKWKNKTVKMPCCLAFLRSTRVLSVALQWPRYKQGYRKKFISCPRHLRLSDCFIDVTWG